VTQKQIERLLTTHRAQRDRAKRMLDQRYYELEERNEETNWVDLYVKHKDIVEWLEAQKPDDE
jgi:hypothetical protein